MTVSCHVTLGFCLAASWVGMWALERGTYKVALLHGPFFVLGESSGGCFIPQIDLFCVLALSFKLVPDAIVNLDL